MTEALFIYTNFTNLKRAKYVQDAMDIRKTL